MPPADPQSAQAGPARGPRPLEPVPATPDRRSDALLRLVRVVERLRAPDGCPWDLEQTVESLAPSLVEEAHELVEAIETGDARGTVEEAGDVLMGVLLLSEIGEQSGRFDLVQVANGVADKLIRRHPHVFGEGRVEGADAALSQWERIKKAERELRRAEGREREDTSVLAGVPKALPALQRVQRLGGKAMSAGFRWGDARGALAKLREELGELEEAFAAREALEPGPQREAVERAMERELGDVVFAAAQFANYVDLDAEAAGREATRRFERRFRAMEALLGGPLRERSLDELMEAWRSAKASLAARESG